MNLDSLLWQFSCIIGAYTLPPTFKGGIIFINRQN